MTTVTLSGLALHSGQPATVHLRRASGPTRLVQGAIICELGRLHVVRTDHGVSVADPSGRLQIDLVEHLFAALAVLHANQSVEIELEGPEFPLLDGGAARWLGALQDLGVREEPATHRIARAVEYVHGRSRYFFAPGDGVELEVIVDFDPPLGIERAAYRGDLRQFREQTAPARTFGFVRDAERLKRAGRASHIDPASVLVLEDDGSLALPSAPRRPNELAAHKLLDAVGDSLLYGGVFRGSLRIERPGHTANHAIFRRALSEGILTPVI